MALAAITDPEQPYTRRSFSPLFLEGPRLAESAVSSRPGSRCADRRRRQSDRPARRQQSRTRGTIMLGSHSDTVPYGGRFDGIAGVLAALEVARALKAAGVRARATPSRSSISSPRSRATSASPASAAAAWPARWTTRCWPIRMRMARRCAEAIDRVGGDVAHLERARRSDIAGFLELHIEQGVGAAERQDRYRHRHRDRRHHPHRDRLRGRGRPCRHDADGIRASDALPRRGAARCCSSSSARANSPARQRPFRRHRRRILESSRMPPMSCPARGAHAASTPAPRIAR